MKVDLKKNAPDFLIIGAAKSGTTSLWHYLHQHPKVFMNQGTKELGYFSDHYGVCDLDEYLKFFDYSKPDQLLGEACHAYLSSPESANKIFKFNPRMKIIMILRNPVDRAYSLYNWMVQYGYESANSFRKALMMEEQRINDAEFSKDNAFYFMNYLYYTSGLYYEQVKRYYELFPESNIHVVVYELFKTDNLKHLNFIFAFLGLPSTELVKLEKQNESHKIFNPKLQYFLFNNFTRVADSLLVPRKISFQIKRGLFKLNRKSCPPSKIDDSIRENLFHRYTSDIKKLSELIKIDLFKYWS